jgi:tRNA-dependent cyclodipeptide synthase
MDYQIKKIRSYPSRQINWTGGLYLGMSMSNTAFQDSQRLKLILNEITSRNKKFTLLVGDFLHRYNEQIFGGLSEKDAIESSLKKGEMLVKLFVEIADEIENVQYSIIHTSKFLQYPSFTEKMNRLRNCYKANNHFRELIEYTIDVFLRRQIEIKTKYEVARELCRNYLFEELAIFEILSEEGFNVNIYPGNQLVIIKAIITGSLKNVSESLERIQAIEIKLRPKST